MLRLTAPPPSLSPDLCSLPSDPGDCDAVFPSFFFNSETERCEEFTYGGCGGNLNRFETRRACLLHCDPDSKPVVHISLDFDFAVLANLTPYKYYRTL